jgi:hypothetical protein
MRREIPAISSILTHIESEPATIERHVAMDRNRELELRLRHVARAFPEILDIHDIVITRLGAAHKHPTPDSAPTHPSDPSAHRIQINCHCTMPDDLPMARVHAVITAFEDAFKLDSPEVSRLLIHPEPATDNRR